ncbi:permease [Cohaesibacter celericrescens]|uniref:Permease n=1 Tax=Cohaesibacter celericrescens TaxID=2067669 RepID=A0A2N5XT21_9HYPH|nr:permease [Cohaesibacter celericrescens]PLW77620.1 permease [Cohaesibacter celericrescens]
MSEFAEPDQSSWRQSLSTLQSPWTIVVLIPVMVSILDFSNLVPVVDIAVTAFLGTVPVIAFAVFLIAYLKAAGAEAVIAEAFKGKEVRMIFLAALLGGLAPFCSCEVIPFIAGLLALGAPLSAVMAFWLSSPLIDPPTLLITASVLGWPFAVGKAISAVALGLFGGFIVSYVMKAGLLTSPLKQNSVGCSSCGCGPSPFSGKPVWAVWKDNKRKDVFVAELKTNALFLVKWLALAYMLEGLLITYVPASVIAGLVGGTGIGPIAIAAVVGIPAYLNSYIAPPLLAGLMEQGMSAGAAMSFMVAGAVSSIPAMAAVWSLVKRAVFALYIGLGITGAILSGIVFQLVV